MRRLAPVTLLCLALAGCNTRQPAPPSPAHYTVGSPYQLGGTWYYPRDETGYDATGLAAITPDHAGMTADGERFEQTALAASHRTLQLPAIVRVTNLENGRSILVRLNDRGPENPGRLIGLTRHAAALLGAVDGTRLRVVLDGARSQAAADQAGGSPKLDISAAPLASVATEQLAPPPGMRQAARRGPALAAGASEPSLQRAEAAPSAVALPDEAQQGVPAPGAIYLRADEFSRGDLARRQAAQLGAIGATVERIRMGRSEQFRVRAGPFATVSEADAALDQARRAGVIDSRLVVE